MLPIRTFLLIVIYLGLTLNSHHAYAGFEWIPPKKESPKIETIPATSEKAFKNIPTAPVRGPIVQKNTLAPQLLAQRTTRQSNTPTSPRQSANMIIHTQRLVTSDGASEIYKSAETGPSSEALLKIKPLALSKPVIINPYPLQTQSEPATAEKELLSYPNAVGFGDQIPLAMALGQILPSGYTYSFKGMINPGQLVSWSGGKPWNIVIADMIRPAGLYAHIDGNIVSIGQD